MAPSIVELVLGRAVYAGEHAGHFGYVRRLLAQRLP
jgi:hypothetical protein